MLGLAFSLVAAALSGSLGAGSPLAAPAGPDAGSPSSCVAVRGEARHNGYGYKHVVVLTSSCAKIADCNVSTDVNPAIQKVEVAPKAVVEVVTFFDSPASVFTPNVTCVVRK